MRTHRTITGPVLVALVAMLLAPAGTALARYPDPAVITVEPASGDVVSAGRVAITGILHSSRPIGEVSLHVDGEAYPVSRKAGSSAHDERFKATVELAAGSHIADVRFTDADGRLARRMWRFATTDLPVHRLAGTGRVETAVQISRDSYPDDGTLTAAVLATAGDFPDALAAAPVAHALGGPMLLTAGDALSGSTAAELQRVLAPVATVWLMGGEAALSKRVADDVRALGYTVERIAGSGRESTAAMAAERHLPDASTVVVTASGSFADALSAAAPAARDGAPILLTGPSNLSAAARGYIEPRDIQRAIVIGGRSAVGDGVVQQLETMVPNVERVAGATRFSTSLAVAERFWPQAPSGASIASGVGFADALAGGAHAARLDQPLLLAQTDGVPEIAVRYLTESRVEHVHLYGGTAALDRRVALAGRRASVNDAASPRVLDVSPAAGTTVTGLDTIQVSLDGEVQPQHTAVYVTLDGYEWMGAAGQGDFADTVVFRPGDVPIEMQPQVDYDVDVYVATYDGSRWHHLHWTFELRKIEVSRGDTGPAVRELQERLRSLGYWLPRVDGEYGYLTSHAVMAFQKWEGLPRTGSADRATLDRLVNAQRPVVRSVRPGRWVEVDKTRQVMLFALDGRVLWTMNTSTGTEKPYTRPDGTRGVAHTPEGVFTFFRQIDGMREAELGQMWRPKYFTDAGHAIHGSTSVPAYAASHGCARLSYPAIDFVWANDLAPLGTRIYIYR